MTNDALQKLQESVDLCTNRCAEVLQENGLNTVQDVQVATALVGSLVNIHGNMIQISQYLEQKQADGSRPADNLNDRWR